MTKLSLENQDGKPRKVFDLVCGMELNMSDVTNAFEHEGKEYYFCSETCKGHFVSDPDMYIGEN
jgi:YHS domain-containing protein